MRPRTRLRDRPSLVPLPARWRNEHPSVPTVLPLPASVHAPHPTRRGSGSAVGGCAPTKAAFTFMDVRRGMGLRYKMGR